MADNDIVSAAGWAAVALAVLTAIGLAAIAVMAARTPAVFDAAGFDQVDTSVTRVVALYGCSGPHIRWGRRGTWTVTPGGAVRRK